MRKGLREVLLSVGLATAAMACGTPDIDGTPLSSGRGAVEETDEGETPAENVLAEQEAGSLAPAATSSGAPCASSDLALCFTFESSPNDESATKLQPAMAAGIGFVPGKLGNAAAFQAGSALRFAPSAVFDLPADAATIEAWISRTPTGADAVVFDDDERFSLTIDAGGHVWCKSSGGAVVGATFIPGGKWVHVACVIDKGTMRAYLDGVVDAIGTGAVAPAVTPTAAAAVGGNSPSGEEFNGTIDLLRVFRTARTPEQIASSAKGFVQ